MKTKNESGSLSVYFTDNLIVVNEIPFKRSPFTIIPFNCSVECEAYNICRNCNYGMSTLCTYINHRYIKIAGKRIIQDNECLYIASNLFINLYIRYKRYEKEYR